MYQRNFLIFISPLATKIGTTGLLFSLLTLTACSLTAVDRSTQQSYQQLQQQLIQLSNITHTKQQISHIENCRYQITTEWDNYNTGALQLMNQQRFDLRHDLRSIEHTPRHQLAYKGQQQEFSDKLHIIFNRPLPYSFSYYDNQTLQPQHTELSRDHFSLLGQDMAPESLIAEIKTSLTELAKSCGNSLTTQQSWSQQVLGNWQLHGAQQLLGQLQISPDLARLQLQDIVEIQGSYQLIEHTEYLELQISSQQQSYSVRLYFINSITARAQLALNTEQQPKYPLNNRQSNQQNNKEQQQQLVMFRLGDLL